MTLEEAITESPGDASYLTYLASSTGRQGFTRFVADPTDPDSDSDQNTIEQPDADPNTRDDAEEFNEGTDPFLRDSDFDLLPDEVEMDIWGTDPLNPNTDEDFFTLDGTETTQRAMELGLDPLIYDAQTSVTEAIQRYAEGIFCGDLAENVCGWLPPDIRSDGNYVAGTMVSGLAVYGDILSLGAAAINGDPVGGGFAIVGLVPLLGDSIKSVRTARQLSDLRRTIDLNDVPQLREAAKGSFFRTLGTEPDFNYIEDTLRAIDNQAFEAARANGLTEGGIRSMLARGQDPLRQADSLDGVGLCVLRTNQALVISRQGSGCMFSPLFGPPPREFTAKGGEQATRLLGDFINKGKQLCVKGICEKGKIRIVDAWDEVKKFAVEVKTGVQKNSVFIQRQILKDALLVEEGTIVHAEWQFLANASGVVKVDQRILDFLDDPNKIPDEIWIDVLGGRPPGLVLDPIPYQVNLP